ncbi:MAG TPA: xanthine dehydrogenase family protein molybdopterin-binding subunit, partial [Acidimicrobiia bacterium]|nr:xanthine dehydrogenase family protein molybdopterin-binding subunit [Acidimicrobiia bacterium]
MVDTPQLTAGRFVGQKVLRKEDPRLLTGRGHYVDDVSLTGMLHATFVRSDVARARITRLDVDAARTAPGVVAVLTAADLNDRVAVSMLPSLFQGAEDFSAPIRPLARDDVRFVGDPVALVVAESRYLAEDAAELVEADYETLPAVVDYESAAASPELVHPDRPANVAMMMGGPIAAELQEVFDAAAHTVTETFRQHRYSMVPMECRGIVARFDPFDQRLDVWVSSQNPHEARLVFSRVTGLPENSIRVQIGDVGGGFGLKSFVGREEQTVALAAYVLKSTVKWMEDRHEHLIASAHARVEKATVTMAVDAEGHFLGAYADHVDDSGAYPIGGGSAGPLVCALITGPYRVPQIGFRTTTVWTNTCGKAAYRGPWMMETVAREQMVDVVARAIGMDPVELRRRNVIHRSELPYTSAGGQFIDNVSPEETLEQCTVAIGYDAFRAEQARAKADGRLLGVGFALYVEPQTNFGPYGNEPAHLRIAPDGHVDVYIASGAHGQGLETTTAQLTAEFLGVHVDDVTVHQGDTEATPYGPGTGGSRSGPMIGAAVHDAAVLLQDKIFAVAGHLLEAAPADLEMAASVVSVKGTPAKSVTLARVAQTAHLSPGTLPDDVDPVLEVMYRYKAPGGVWSNACHACT